MIFAAGSLQVFTSNIYPLISIQDTIVSEEILSNKFVCQLTKCKGICCVKGDMGAPLERDEIPIIERELKNIAPFMTPKYLKTVQEKGFAEKDEEGEFVTTCQPEGECNFVVYDDGIAGCAIEKAWKAGATDFQKPVSCHLYPVRVAKYKEFRAVNYNEWHICQPACTFGEELGIPVYTFVKDALIRKFGQEWYDELEAAAEYLKGIKDMG